MKRTLLVLLLPLSLVGCAQLFDANLYGTIDVPPPLNAGALKSASVDEIQSMMQDDSFVELLKDDPEALAGAQDALTTAMEDPDATEEEAMEAGATLIELTTGGSGVADLKDNAINNLTTIADAVSAQDYSLALKLFMGSKTTDEVKATLDNLVVMADTLAFMQGLATTGTDTVDSNVFFSGTSSKATFAQSAFMAAVAHALVKDAGGTTALATDLAAADPSTGNGGFDMTEFVNAYNAATPSSYTVASGTATPGSGYSYAYVAILKAEITF